jgi:gluconate 2-dehydrogenase gamma chain
MDRRQAVKTLGAMMGASLLLPASVLAHAEEIMEGNIPKARFFDRRQKRLVAALAECVIPRTDTPGAKDAGVPAWIEVIAQDCLDAKDQARFLEGLKEVEAAAFTKFGKSFVKAAYNDQIALLTDLEKTAILQRKEKKDAPPAFLLSFKDLVRFTYVNSKRGATEAFDYLLVPGRWDGSAPVGKVPSLAW